MLKLKHTPVRNNLSAAAFMAGAAKCAAVVLFILTAAGCASHSGRFTVNAEVEQAFRTGHPQTDHNYYYAGRDTMPYAIIGIDSSFTVPSKYWIPFEPEPETLKKMSGNMYWKNLYNPYGAHMLAPDGTIVGVWFSSIRFHSVKVDQQQRTVDVLFQNPESTRDL
jgi:hypothetical protein